MEIEAPKTVFSKEIEALLSKERDARLNNDYNESARILPEIVKLLLYLFYSFLGSNCIRFQRI